MERYIKNPNETDGKCATEWETSQTTRTLTGSSTGAESLGLRPHVCDGTASTSTSIADLRSHTTKYVHYW